MEVLGVVTGLFTVWVIFSLIENHHLKNLIREGMDIVKESAVIVEETAKTAKYLQDITDKLNK